MTTHYLIGGLLHGQTRDLEDGSASTVDIATGTTYYLKPIRYIARDVHNRPQSLWQTSLLVHESLMIATDDQPALAQQKHQLVMQLWGDLIMSLWMTTNATQVPLSEAPDAQRARPAGPPASTSRQNGAPPRRPSGILGPNGQAL